MAMYARNQGGLGSTRHLPTNTQREYVDPASFFRFHGYITLTYTEAEDKFDQQILLSGVSPESGENEGGFKNDSALFVGGEPFKGVSSVIELHFVGNTMVSGHYRSQNRLGFD